SLSPSSFSAGYAEQPTASVPAARKSGRSAVGATSDTVPGLPAPPTSTPPVTAKTRTADLAPPGSFDVAPRGALSGRDYSLTALDVERARDLINAYRRQNGLKPLTLHPKLTEAAKLHARDLAKWDRISHFGSDGSNPWDRVKRSGYNARLAAENVGTGQVTFEEVLKGWKDSPGHNKNLLLADADHIGLALVQDPKTEFKTFWTLVLGAPL
ncbi:MAG TPA: CAP domain-containing protein, partial [Hyphomicrobiaceae bacterium]|nr:CAP domain-containing protein [Hyphomicrobiaceae bacterium]